MDSTYNTKEASSQIAFWYPPTGTIEDATYSIEFKAPEEGNTERRARNQSIVRTRAGNTLVYDRGNDFNTMFKLDFKDIPDVERAQLVVFLEVIQWGSTKIKYRDVYGDEYVVRIIAESGIEYSDNGLNLKRGKSFIRWSFSLELLNLTDNPGDLEAVDTVPTSALLLHIADYDDPHSPATNFTVNDADVNTILGEVITLDWRSVIYTVAIAKGVASATFAICVTHNRADILTIATESEIVVETLCEQGDAVAHVTFTASLSGAGVDQVSRLLVNTNADGWKLEVRRIKLGANIYA